MMIKKKKRVKTKKKKVNIKFEMVETPFYSAKKKCDLVAKGEK